MRIPTSLIVMSVVTAIPFGLAIRDTIAGDRRLTKAEREAAEQRAMEEAYEAKMADEHEQIDAVSPEAREAAQIAMMVGEQRATLGPLFQTYELGKDLPANDAQMQKTARESGLSVQATIGSSSTIVESIRVTLDAPTATGCPTLRAAITAAWGEPTSNTWLAESQRQRARLSGCALRIEPTLPAEAWLSQVDVLGMSLDELRRSAGVSNDELGVHWDAPGIGHGAGRTDLFVVLHDGKVAYVLATVDTDAASVTALREAVSAKLRAQPVHDDKRDRDVWNKGPTARMRTASDSGKLVLELGKELAE